MTPTPKITPKDKKKSLKGPKKVLKRAKIWPNSNQKVRAVLPKPKYIVYIGRSQKSFLTIPQPEKSSFTFHFSIPNFQIPNFLISNFQNPNYQIPNVPIPKFRFPNIQIANFQIANFQILKFQTPNFRIPNF